MKYHSAPLYILHRRGGGKGYGAGKTIKYYPTEATLATIRNIQESSFKRHPLKQKGKVYLNSMLSPSIIRKTWQKVKAGIIKKYVKHPKQVDLIGLEK